MRRRNVYTAILTHSKEERWWTAVCVEIPAAITQGRTIKDVKRNLRDAIRLVLDASGSKPVTW
ncbi:MAG TPA: type II toxin-antitoxin system HicB family antitoxin [Planctomycetota bacterium]